MRTILKHRWSLSHNYLAGITTDKWWRLLRENRFAVSPAYAHRAAFITLSSVMNSFCRVREQKLHDEAVGKTSVSPPVFILGHWRTGTTHLHNLLALDTDQFGFANTYQVVNPYTFLTTEEVNTRRFAWMVPDKRPMDNVALSFQAPQEDEFAPCLMTLYSLYLGISFPQRGEHYDQYLSFRDVPRVVSEEWKQAFLWFLKKLTFKHDGKALVLKSPPHTARIRLLLELFPDARFVHIHRHPFAVYRSFCHYFDTAAWHCYLQRPDVERIGDQILARYTALHDAYFADRNLIPEGQFHEIRYENLERNPVEEVRQVYQKLNLPGFARFQPKLQQYVDSLLGYQKNAFPGLDAKIQERVSREWGRSFDAWGYSPTDANIR